MHCNRCFRALTMIVHTAWLGNPSSDALACLSRLQNLDPACEVRHYTDGSEVWPEWQSTFDSLENNPRMQSDLLRHSLLRKYGGLWLDLDVTLTVSPKHLVSGWDDYTVLRLIPRSPWAATDIIYATVGWSGWSVVDEYVASVDTSKRLSHLAFAHDMILWASRAGAPVCVLDDSRLYPCRKMDITSDALVVRCGQDVIAGLGDMVAAGLSAIGITPERVSKALGVKDCGCKKRAEALNRIGRKFGIG